MTAPARAAEVPAGDEFFGVNAEPSSSGARRSGRPPRGHEVGGDLARAQRCDVERRRALRPGSRRAAQLQLGGLRRSRGGDGQARDSLVPDHRLFRGVGQLDPRRPVGSSRTSRGLPRVRQGVRGTLRPRWCLLGGASGVAAAPGRELRDLERAELRRYWSLQEGAPRATRTSTPRRARRSRPWTPTRRSSSGAGGLGRSRIRPRDVPGPAGSARQVDAIGYHEYHHRLADVRISLRQIRATLRRLGDPEVPIEITEAGWSGKVETESHRERVVRVTGAERAASWDRHVTRVMPYVWYDGDSTPRLGHRRTPTHPSKPAGRGFVDSVAVVRLLAARARARCAGIAAGEGEGAPAGEGHARPLRQAGRSGSHTLDACQRGSGGGPMKSCGASSTSTSMRSTRSWRIRSREPTRRT